MLHEMTATVLDRPVYGMGQVDALLGLRSGTSQRWIDGYDRRGLHYRPVIRAKTTRSDVVTWGEFVEASLLANYRESGVLMIKMRPVVERLRAELKTTYPLAAARLWLYPEGGELVRRVQEDLDLDPALHLVEVIRTRQIASAPSRHVTFTRQVEDFLERVDFEDQVAARIYPLGKKGAVVLDPFQAFGAPAIRSVRTDVLAEERRAGESVDAIADGYGLTRQEVEDAIRYELRVA